MKPLDFGKLATGGNSTPVTDPRRLFSTLSRKPRFRRPSDNQGEVLTKWHSVRDQRDVTLKMNTGSGKTLVGLLLLQSSLNEGVGPAVFITPDNYLASQVMAEAGDLGIAVTADERSAEFAGHKAILVTTIKKLFNGRSTFGVGQGQTRIRIGSIVIDDAHACLAMVDEQFAVKLPRESPTYQKLFKVFKDSLAQQSTVGMVQVESGDPTAYVQLPFWTWNSNLGSVASLFVKNRDSEELRFTWPLLADSLSLCQCIFGGQSLEISPRCIPVHTIPAFQSAKRRIYMTATLADDGVLVSHFDANPVFISKPVRPDGVGEMGDRMILAPQQINPSASDDELRDLVQVLAEQCNVVVIVPSTIRLAFWKPIAGQILDKNNIESGVARLKQGEQVGVTVLLNKYDGVDLPGDACRVLVVDGLPEVYGLSERVEFAALDGTELQLVKQVQRIEQGMGRGVRSGDDYCVVLLTGRRLTERLNLPTARKRFSAATQAQLALGESVAAQYKGRPLAELLPVLELCLKQDAQWVAASRAALANAVDGPDSFLDPTVVPRRLAFNAATSALWDQATAGLQALVNKTTDPAVKGYLNQQLSEYIFHLNPNTAQEILLSGIQQNPRILRPLAGVVYAKLASPVVEQAAQVTVFNERFRTGNDLVIWGNGLIEDLTWSEEATERFERGIENLALFLGFGSQRPESTQGKGPDNLWALGQLTYIIIECKSGASTSTISKSDCNQLTGSVEWFHANYDASCKAVPIIIHPSFTFDRYSTPKPETKVIDVVKLSELKVKLAAYTASLSQSTVRSQPTQIAKLLKEAGFTAASFASNYARSYSIASK